MEVEKIKQYLVSRFENNLAIERNEIESKLQENYFETGWIDSFGFINFIFEIEKKFEIRFSNDEFQDRNFATIIGLAQIIKSRIDERNEKI